MRSNRQTDTEKTVNRDPSNCHMCNLIQPRWDVLGKFYVYRLFLAFSYIMLLEDGGQSINHHYGKRFIISGVFSPLIVKIKENLYCIKVW